MINSKIMVEYSPILPPIHRGNMTYKTIEEIALEVEKKQKLCGFLDFKELEEIETYNITEWYEPRKLCFNFTVVKHIPTNKFYQFKDDMYAEITYFDGEVESKQIIKNEWVIKNNKQFD